MANKNDIIGESINSYLEYRRIVGDDDNGQLFDEKKYEEYKEKIIPQRLQNRLYTSWSNKNGMDCKLIGPETLCFCDHRYKEHKTDFEKLPTERPILLSCRSKGCRCKSYRYVPLISGAGIRCVCKHVPAEHDAKEPNKCQKTSCKTCTGFKSSYTCACKVPFNDHVMVVETKDERMARGLPLGQDTPYQAMGGITGFSSLADGYARLDASGIGVASEEFLSQEITSNDHPFLRAAVPSIKALNSKYEREALEGMSSMRLEHESEFDYYERRYKEKQKVTIGPPRRNKTK